MPDKKQTTKPKSVSLYNNNKTAFVDSTLNANKDKEWVKRLYQKNTPKMYLQGENKPSTHLMGDNGAGYVFPTLVQLPGQNKLTNLDRRAEDYARESNTGIQFKNKEQGDYFASHKNKNGGYGGYKNGTGVLSEFREGTKNIQVKKLKTKKAVAGLQSVAVPEQGSTSNVLSSAATMAASGAQFGPWGALAGGVIGLGTGLFQKSSQDKANREAKKRNQYLSSNRAVSAEDESLYQAPQRFSKGGRVKSKVIEIEGKKTPEIHTDKNFNIKNLGTTPHASGGNKVVANEGDIVFNTQNSITKFNKIANAITTGNKTILKKEQNKLPEDKSSKYPDGTKSTKVKKEDSYWNGRKDPISDMFNFIEKSYANKRKNARQLSTSTTPTKVATTDTNISLYDFLQKGKKTPVNNTPVNTESLPNFLNRGEKIPVLNSSTSNKTIVKPTNTRTNSKPTAKVISNKLDNTKSLDSILKFTPPKVGKENVTGLETSIPLTPVVYDKTIDTKLSTDTKLPVSTTNSGNNTLNNALQFTGVANNIFQGLKKEKPVKQEYYTPEQLKYQDRSESLRRNSTSAASIQSTNARNLSGGNTSNIRANQNVANLSNIGRQNEIDEREQSRADATIAQNTTMRNQASNENLQRKDNYQNIIAGNRAAKESFINQAASDIGQYGQAKQEESYMRNRDALAYKSQDAAYNSITGRYQHKTDREGNPYFEPTADTSITKYGTGGGNKSLLLKKKKSGIFSKGSKSIVTKGK